MSAESILESITGGIAECAAGNIVHHSWYGFRYTLNRIWRPVTKKEDLEEEFVRVDFMRDHRVMAPPRPPSENQPPPK